MRLLIKLVGKYLGAELLRSTAYVQKRLPIAMSVNPFVAEYRA